MTVLVLLLLVNVATSLPAQRADTTVVTLTRPEHPGVATLVPEFSFGRGSAAVEYTFTSPIVFLGRSAVYVVDVAVMNRSSQVREYDRSGNFRRNIGRPGQGPGEYEFAVGSVRELPDGRVLLTDQEGILVFSPEARFLGRWVVRSAASLTGSALFVDPAGFVHTPLGTDGRAPSGSCFMDLPKRLQRFRFDGTPHDVISLPFSTTPSSSRIMCSTVPFVPGYSGGWSPRGYFVTSYNATYAIDIPLSAARGNSPRTGAMWSPTDPVVSLRRTVAPVPVQPRERQEYRDAITRQIRNLRTTPPNWQWNGPDIPQFKPPLKGLFFASDGLIWAQLSQPSQFDPTIVRAGNQFAPVEVQRRWVEPRVFDVVEPSGRYLGQVLFPTGIRQFDAVGDTVWAVVRDKDDVASVVRYRIRWGG